MRLLVAPNRHVPSGTLVKSSRKQELRLLVLLVLTHHHTRARICSKLVIVWVRLLGRCWYLDSSSGEVKFHYQEHFRKKFAIFHVLKFKILLMWPRTVISWGVLICKEILIKHPTICVIPCLLNFTMSFQGSGVGCSSLPVPNGSLNA